ncbi:MAG: hypothetical protein MUF15_20060, partial [Acidobacteria bacterium]|nr:hypothetical protein [Acidobacteriota bacterium]
PQVDDKSIAFIIPFWEAGKDENKSKSFSCEIKENGKTIFIFKFKVERLYFLSKILIEHAPGAIECKRTLELEKTSWEKFKKDNLTFGQFIELVFEFKKFLDIHSKKGNNVKVKSLECLIEKVLPALKLLKKGQDNLFSYLKPHHFHDIQLPEEQSNTCEDCKLLLRYPGKDVQGIEKIIKDRLGQEPDHIQQKKPVVDYTLNSLTNLNRIINEIYVPKIEEYMYGIQKYKFEIIKLKD